MRKRNKTSSTAGQHRSQSQKPEERVDAASGAETAELSVDNTATNAKLRLACRKMTVWRRQARSILKTQARAAPMLQDQHQKMKKNRRQQQPCLLQSPLPKMRIKKQKAGLARHKRRPQIQTKPDKRVKGKRAKNTRGFSGCSAA